MRRKLIKRMRKFILKHGTIVEENWRPPNKEIHEYRKGSYFICFSSDDLEACVGEFDKYSAYKTLYFMVKEFCH